MKQDVFTRDSVNAKKKGGGIFVMDQGKLERGSKSLFVDTFGYLSALNLVTIGGERDREGIFLD